MHPRISLSAAAIAALPTFAVAQSVAPDLALEPVMVTASRFSGSALSIPIGARVIDREDIEASGVGTVAEALNKLGGVHTRQDLMGGSNPGLDLRGFGFTGDQNTLVLLNGVRISEDELTSARLSGISLGSVERIEILPSGGAVLYGANATGGVINIITRRASAGREANLSAGAGKFGTRDVNLTGSVASGPWSFAASAQDYASDNHRRNNRVEQGNVRGEAAWTTESARVAVDFGNESQRARMPGPRNAAQWQNDRWGTSTPNDYAHTDAWFVGVSGSQRWDQVEFAANLTRREKDMDFVSQGAGFLMQDRRHTVSHQFSPRIRVSAPLAGRKNELIVGIDWREWDFASTRFDDFGFGFAGPSRENGKQTNEAFYFQDTWQILPATRLSFGGRTETSHVRRDVPYALTMTAGGQERKDHLNAWTSALRQELADGLAVLGRIGRSYRIPTIDENRCFGAPCSLLLPQKSLDRELGLSWAGSNWKTELTYFDIKLDKELYYNNLLFQNMNLPATRRTGFEIAGQWWVLPTVELQGRYSVTEAKFREGVFGGVDVTGKTVPVVPRQRASLLAVWSLTAKSKVSAGLNHVGSQHYDNDPANRFARMPAYTTADLKLTHQIGDARLGLTVNNLFDEKYYSYGLVNSSTAPTSYNVYPDRPRSFMATLEYAFR